MKRLINFIALVLFVSANCVAQDANHTFRIMNLTPDGVKISDKIVEQYDCFNETEKITWLKKPSSMIVKPQVDIRYVDLENKQRIWYKGVTAKVNSSDKNHEKSDLFWWIKYNKSSSKGNEEFSFDGEFLMFENELIIEIPEILDKGQGYMFVSLENGKSFYSINEDSKPLIMITRDKLDSIGFNGKAIKLKVLYLNYYNEPKVVSESMTIINY